MSISELTQGKKFKTFMARLYGWGASVVIVGALFKIQHYPGAGLMLVIGLGTEAVIFFFSAFEPPHEEVDWSLVYPELSGMHDEDNGKERRKKIDPVSQRLDKLMSDANIGPELIDSLGAGLRNLGDNVGKMADVSNASMATDQYAKSMNDASSSVGNLARSFESAAAATSGFSSSADNAKVYNDQIVSAGKNLAALNAVYELQLQDSNDHLKQTNKYYEGISELLNNLNASLDDTRKYRDEVSQLAKNLSQLNTIYGNMLSAMTGNR